MTQIKR